MTPLAILLAAGLAASDTHAVGVAAADVTPKTPIRLNGFGGRRAESEGVYQKVWAKALAIGDKDPAVVVTVDNLGIPSELVAELEKRLRKRGVQKGRVAVTATHTHTAPMLRGANLTLFGVPIPKEHLDRIDKHTDEFLDGLEKAAVAALDDRKPARLSWGIGQAAFAANRRTRGGSVDHDLPLMVAKSPEGKIRALWVNYACHAVTLSHNKVGGDWPGYASQAIEDDHKGAIALVSVGCGADSNPSSGVTGDKVEVAQRQGMEIAREVRRMLKGYLAPVAGPLLISTRTVELPLADLPTKAEWEKRANRKDAIGHHARVTLEKLARGEKLPTKIDYPITAWEFGDSLAMLFLPGEVVVDYALRLKKELDGRRLWINAYANDDPCYIPSERILKEGGYEGGGAMVYYDVPAPFRPGVEKSIVNAVHGLLGKRYSPPFDPKRTDPPLPPQRSAANLVPKKGFVAQLVAAEPLVRSPVAIDFGPDGRLWVAEMVDYPAGPGRGRVCVLEDVDGDGIYDKSTVFLDDIPFPTGVTIWRDGVLVCAAPDILFARDTDGDGKADKVTKLFSGFGTHNYQGRVNSLCYGLDGWVHGSCGLFGGTIATTAGKPLKLGDRDFRIHPDYGVIQPATGRTQQGRARDDWGNWFGCDNSNLAFHHVLTDHYLSRNPHVAPPAATANVAVSNQVFPLRTLQMFKLSGPPGRATAACGLGVYRDDLLGDDTTGDLFTCESVNLVVTRRKLFRLNSTFTGRRADDERESEFLAATDPWFRPVQVRTGPDGALWVVDMHRYVIEHPRWIPPEELAKVDPRAGATLGRIYRVYAEARPPRKVPRLDKMTSVELVEAMDTPNGTVRDLAMQMLLWRWDRTIAKPLMRLATCPRPAARLQALCTLDGLGLLTAAQVKQALEDCVPGVRRHAVRLAEKFLPELLPALLPLVDDADAQVRLQLAFTLGTGDDPNAAKALANLALRHPNDPHLVAAVMSSVGEQNVAGVVEWVMKTKSPHEKVLRPLLATLAAVGDGELIAKAVRGLTPTKEGFAALAAVLDTLERRKMPPPESARIRELMAKAREIAVDPKVGELLRVPAIELLGREDDLALLGGLLTPRHPPAVQAAALLALSRSKGDGVPGVILAGWKPLTPTTRGQALDLLLGRPAWRDRLLTALEKGEIAASHLDAARRQRLLTHADEAVRQRAAKLFADTGTADRQKVVRDYADALALKGDAGRGKAAFAKHCASCHRLEGVGHEVGPDLQALANKTPAYLLSEILDPNRNLDSRYLQYLVTTTRGLSHAGLLAAETSASLTLKLAEGKSVMLIRPEIEEMHSASKSLMPEGLEKDISKADMADLLTYLTRQDSPKGAAEQIAEMTAGLKPGKEEYQRIPAIWRVAIATGKRDDAAELTKILEVSLPKAGEPLRDWQAVVLGGGVVNGISLSDKWPDERLAALLKDNAALRSRWVRSLKQAAAMADDAKVPAGTRYDALRMIALGEWETHGETLAKYLAKGTNDELMQGAVSGLSDARSPKVAALLIGGMGHYSTGNRKLAVEALLRTEERVKALLDSLESGAVTKGAIAPEHRKTLLGAKDKAIRARAEKVFQ